jgi:hypothetical protein
VRRIRKANIPSSHRDLFERYGQNAVTLVITSGFNPGGDLGPLHTNQEMKSNATLWLTEQADKHACNEIRREIVEWAILIFVILGVIIETISLIRGTH